MVLLTTGHRDTFLSSLRIYYYSERPTYMGKPSCFTAVLLLIYSHQTLISQTAETRPKYIRGLLS